MSTLAEPKPTPQARAVEIVADALRILKTRDGIDIPEALVLERARKAVSGLQGAFDLVPTADGEQRALGRLLSFGSPPPVLRPGSPLAARMAEFLSLRAELAEADREFAAETQRLGSMAPGAGSVG
jgi:hypothetical protein